MLRAFDTDRTINGRDLSFSAHAEVCNPARAQIEAFIAGRASLLTTSYT